MRKKFKGIMAAIMTAVITGSLLFSNQMFAAAQDNVKSNTETAVATEESAKSVLKFSKESQVLELTDKDAARVAEVFGLTEYNGKIVVLEEGQYYEPDLSKEPTSYYTYVWCYEVERNESGELIFGRYSTNSTDYGDWSVFDGEWSVFDGGYPYVSHTEYRFAVINYWYDDGSFETWIAYVGDVKESVLEFKEGSEMVTELQVMGGYNPSDSDALISKDLIANFDTEKKGYFNETDSKVVAEAMGYSNFRGYINIISDEGTDFKFRFDKSSYEKEDISSIYVEYYNATRDDLGNLKITDCIEWKYAGDAFRDYIYCDKGTIISHTENVFAAGGNGNTNLEEAVFRIPGINDYSEIAIAEGQTVKLVHVKISTLKNKFVGYLFAYNSDEVLETLQFEEIIDVEDTDNDTNDDTDNNTEIPSTPTDTPDTPADDEASGNHFVYDATENAVVTTEKFEELLATNKDKDIVIKSNNDVTFTFAKGTMAAVENLENYDFTTVIETDYTAANVPAAIKAGDFIAKINYNYSGKLPAKASIKFYVGTEYAGKILSYSLLDENSGIRKLQSVEVDKDGYMTVEQEHCSSYVVTTIDPTAENTAPDTADNANVTELFCIMICAAVLGVIVAAKKYRAE